jgi:hypothetical protein
LPIRWAKVSGVELKRFAAEKDIECAWAPLVWLEERYVRKHLGCFVVLRQ